KELLEKNNEIKKMQRESQQELLKLRADIEIMKQDFIEKEKHFNESIKLLQEEEEEKEEEEEDKKDNDYVLSSNTTYSSTFSFDMFCSSSKLLKTFIGHTSTIWTIDYSTFNDSQYICSGSQDCTVRVWDIDNNKQIKLFNGHSNAVTCVKFVSYYRHYHKVNNCLPIVCSSACDSTIRFWDFETTGQFQ
ncbi:hypothetical protein RFI_34112, partial [Reticulomyxa filosa]